MEEREVLHQIRTLRRELSARKRAMECHGMTGGQELAAIEALRTRLQEARQLLGEHYLPTEAERRAAVFHRRLESVREIHFVMDDFFARRREVSVTVTDREAVLVSSAEGRTEERRMDRQAFVAALQDMHMGEWLRTYDPARFGQVVCDGTQWTLCIAFDRGRTACFTGSNDYPYNFSQLLRLLDVA